MNLDATMNPQKDTVRFGSLIDVLFLVVRAT